MSHLTTAGHSVDALTLEDKAALTSGAAYWVTKEPSGVPVVTMEDGPHGVRHQSAGETPHMGIAPSEPATCFPPAVAVAQTWDPELVERLGEALGREARSFDTDVLLGPGVNIKRDPRCGRNFEYFSEDPLLSGQIGAAWVTGLQRSGAGASLKHFAANNQELDRMRSSSDIDERPLREIYLRTFERVVREAKPWTVMASYNKLNGIPATENHWLLTEVLRGEWGFDGAVVSDWGAVGDRVRALRAGTDLQMPGGDLGADAEVVAAIEDGSLDPAVLDQSVQRMLDLAERAEQARIAHPDTTFDEAEHHALAREVAGRAIVLLKNDEQVLPLGGTGAVAVVGPFATSPRIQGGGSSRVIPTRTDVPFDELRALAPDVDFRAVEGYRHDGTDAADLRQQAVEAAKLADTAVVFLGLTAADEAEGTDRTHINVPAEQIQLLRAVAAAQPKTVAVLIHGGVIALAEIAESVPAVLDATILGQAGGGAIADVLLGRVNPSGRLAETAPVRLEDAPSYLTYPGDQLHVRYGEGIFVGYRGYDHLRREVAFPFGHGLSYTQFEYADLQLVATPDGIRVEVAVRNTGSVDGREVIQLYVSKEDGVQRPPMELRGYRSVGIKAGETAHVTITIPRQDLAYWDIGLHRWVVEGGEYGIHAAASSRDIRRSGIVRLDGDAVRRPFTEESTVAELLRDPIGAATIADIMGQGNATQSVASQELGIDANKSGMRIPIGRLRTLSAGRYLPKAQLTDLLQRLNASRVESAQEGNRSF